MYRTFTASWIFRCLHSLHQKKWSEYLLPYLQKNGIVFYTTEIGENYLRSVAPDLTLSPKRVLTRSIHILSTYLETGDIPKMIVQIREHPLTGEVGDAACLFLKELINKRRCETTVLKHRRNLSYFIVFLETKSKSKPVEIEEEDIVSFLSTSGNARDRYFTMRSFLRFLYSREYIQTDFEYIFLATATQSKKSCLLYTVLKKSDRLNRLLNNPVQSENEIMRYCFLQPDLDCVLLTFLS